MDPMWDEIASLQIPPTCLVIGEMDQKYEQESKKILDSLRKGSADGAGGHLRVVVPSCGHAVQVERPFALLRVLRNLQADV